MRETFIYNPLFFPPYLPKEYKRDGLKYKFYDLMLLFCCILMGFFSQGYTCLHPCTPTPACCWTAKRPDSLATANEDICPNGWLACAKELLNYFQKSCLFTLRNFNVVGRQRIIKLFSEKLPVYPTKF